MSQILNSVMITDKPVNVTIGSYMICGQEKLYLQFVEPGSMDPWHIHATPQTMKLIHHAIGVWLEQQEKESSAHGSEDTFTRGAELDASQDGRCGAGRGRGDDAAVRPVREAEPAVCAGTQTYYDRELASARRYHMDANSFMVALRRRGFALALEELKIERTVVEESTSRRTCRLARHTRCSVSPS